MLDLDFCLLSWFLSKAEAKQLEIRLTNQST